MADRATQGRTALNIIELAGFRRSSRCEIWRAFLYKIIRTSCFENDDFKQPTTRSGIISCEGYREAE